LPNFAGKVGGLRNESNQPSSCRNTNSANLVGLCADLPKIKYTTQAATLKTVVDVVNCMNSGADKPTTPTAESPQSGLLVETFQVVGPQHSRAYRNVVFAVLASPVTNPIKTVVVTPGMPEATLSGGSGSECRIKINSDNTVDGYCNQTGGKIYVVYR
jgi:hypothetical protein